VIATRHELELMALDVREGAEPVVLEFNEAIQDGRMTPIPEARA
jgi:hypothetical protein